ncbi:MAG: hypothetical protein WCP30_00355 [Mycobacteriaceae bacterium]
MTPHPARHTVTGLPAGSPAHAARPSVPPAHLVVVLATGAVLLAAITLGIWAYLGSTGHSTSTPTSAELITVSPSGHP